MSSDTVISQYHGLLEAGDIAARSAAVMDQQLRQQGLFFGERPLCSVLRPRFLSLDEYRLIGRASSAIGAALEKLRVAAMADSSLRAKFGLEAWEEELIHADPGFPVASPTSRLDAFFAPGGAGTSGGKDADAGLKFTEYNAETPAGAAYNDALSDAFLALPVMQAFGRSHAVFPIPAGPTIVDALLRSFAAWRGRNEKPSIVILDWREVPTYSEFVLFEREFHARGLDAFIGDPRDAEYSNGRLTVAGKPVTLIYKRVLIDELITREGVDSPVVRAVKEGAVCMINPFRCKLLHKKASLAALTDERQSALFSADERQAIAKHVPFTRVVEERRTEHPTDGTVDLIPYIAQHRERFVLKPNDEYGGKGIVLGWTVSDQVWQEAIRSALAEPFIVQERVTVPSEPWPAWADDGLHVGDRMLDTAPFLTDGLAVSGCLTRIATDPLLNVTAGGGSNVPTFLAESR